MPVGLLLAMASAALFGLGNVLAKEGQRRYPLDDGVIFTAMVNVLILGSLTLLLWRDQLQLLTWTGVLFFMLGGLVTTGFGRLSMFAAVREIGASRASLYKVGAPVFTGILAYLFLGEQMTGVKLAASALVLSGLWLLTADARVNAAQARAAAPAVKTGVQDQPAAVAAGGESVPLAGTAAVAAVSERIVVAGGSAGHAQPAAVRGNRERPGATEPRPSGDGPRARTGFGLPRGVLYGLLSALLFGIGFVARKQGVVYVPSVVLGAGIGAASGLLINVGLGTARRGFRGMVDTAIRGVPHWYWWAGGALSLGLLAQFSALTRLEAYVTSIILATEPMWAILVAMALFPGQERLTARTLVSCLAIVGGVALLAAA